MARLGGGDIYIALMVSASLLALGLFCAVVYSRWRGKEMLGLGDVKFFAAAGLWLDPQMVPWFLALAGIIGAITGLAWQRLGGGKESPFAPGPVPVPRGVHIISGSADVGIRGWGSRKKVVNTLTPNP